MGKFPPPKTKQTETAWMDSSLTGAEKDDAIYLMQQLAADGKLESPVRGSKEQGVSKKNV